MKKTKIVLPVMVVPLPAPAALVAPMVPAVLLPVPVAPLVAVVPVLGVQQIIDMTVRAGSSSTYCRLISIKLSAADIRSS
jgi:hypothetical protein